MIEMTLSSRHRIRNLSPGGLRPSTLPLGLVPCEETNSILQAKIGLLLLSFPRQNYSEFTEVCWVSVADDGPASQHMLTRRQCCLNVSPGAVFSYKLRYIVGF